MSETKLSITKEQAEAFVKWRDEYGNRIMLVKVTLRQELSSEVCENSKTYTAMKAIWNKVLNLEIDEGAAKIDGVKIKSDLELGFILSRYITDIEEVFNRYNITEPILFDSLVKKPCKQLEEIFSGK